jgi:hypothetical protein
VGPRSEDDALYYVEATCRLCREITEGDRERGLLFCGTGAGVGIAATSIRASLRPCESAFTAFKPRSINDANVISMASTSSGWKRLPNRRHLVETGLRREVTMTEGILTSFSISFMRWSGSISTNDAVVPLADKIRKNIFILQGRGGERAAARRRRERGRAGNAPRRCPLFNERTEKRGSRAADPTKQGFRVVIPGSLAFSVFAAGPIFCDLGSVRFQDGGCTCFILIVNRNISFSTVYFAQARLRPPPCPAQTILTE